MSGTILQNDDQGVGQDYTLAGPDYRLTLETELCERRRTSAISQPHPEAKGKLPWFAFPQGVPMRSRSCP